jgi:hypothetical protein
MKAKAKIIVGTISAVLVTTLIYFLIIKDNITQTLPSSLEEKKDSSYSQEEYDENYYLHDVEKPEPPEYSTVQWALPHAENAPASFIAWQEEYTPRVEELPDTIQWNFFNPSSKQVISTTSKGMLVRQGFYLEKIKSDASITFDDMIDRYNELFTEGYGDNYSTIPVFISSDFLLHVYHVVFDRMLQNMEEKKFYFRLAELTKKMAVRTKLEVDQAKNKEVYNAALNNFAFFSLAGHILDSTFVLDPRVTDVVKEETARIESAKDVANSSIINEKQDYTQFKPRGHYTKSPRLARYFKALMLYGRSPFYFKTASSSLQSALMVKSWADPSIQKMWHELSDPMDVLVGKSDDVTPAECYTVAVKIFGEDFSENNLLSFPKMSQFMDEVKTIPSSAIVDRSNQKENIQMRFMGQRFIPDSYIFTMLTFPRVGSDASPRNMPKPAEVMAIMGSPFAESLLNSDFSIPKYKQTYSELKDQFSNLPDATWNQSVYWSWLNAIRALNEPKDRRFPYFMRTEAWAKKSLMTALSLWTELRHDTILLSKQSAAEMGEGDEEIPPKPLQPKSYVEPDIDFFNRLVSLIQQTAKTASDYNLLSEEYLEKNSLFLSRILDLRKIVLKELSNGSISKDEYEMLMHFSQDIESIVIPDGSGDVIDDKYKQMALVADVHTDYLGKRALEVGVGSPQRIYVAVKDNSGGSRICVGYTLSYYEFEQPMDKRLNDDEWKEKVYSNNTSELELKVPQWIKSLYVH